MNVKKLTYTFVGYVDTAAAAQSTMDSDVSGQIATIDAAAVTFLSTLTGLNSYSGEKKVETAIQGSGVTVTKADVADL